MSGALIFLGLVTKAGHLECGEESCGAAARSNKAKILLSASDASENSVSHAGGLCAEAGIPHVPLPFSKAEIGGIVGRGLPGMLAVTDAGMAAAFMKKLAAEFPSRYDKAAAAVSEAAEKAAMLRTETKKHKKNARVGAKKKMRPR